MNRALAFALGAVCLVGLARAHAADAGASKAAAAAKPAAAAAKPADGGAPAAAAEKKIDWEHATVAEKKKYMKTTVLPTMKKEFIAFDAKAFKKMNCATCHGDGATDGKFKMPNPKLPKLPKPTPDDFMELQKKQRGREVHGHGRLADDGDRWAARSGHRRRRTASARPLPHQKEK